MRYGSGVQGLATSNLRFPSINEDQYHVPQNHGPGSSEFMTPFLGWVCWWVHVTQAWKVVGDLYLVDFKRGHALNRSPQNHTFPKTNRWNHWKCPQKEKEKHRTKLQTITIFGFKYVCCFQGVRIILSVWQLFFGHIQDLLSKVACWIHWKDCNLATLRTRQLREQLRGDDESGCVWNGASVSPFFLRGEVDFEQWLLICFNWNFTNHSFKDELWHQHGSKPTYFLNTGGVLGFVGWCLISLFQSCPLEEDDFIAEKLAHLPFCSGKM